MNTTWSFYVLPVGITRGAMAKLGLPNDTKKTCLWPPKRVFCDLSDEHAQNWPSDSIACV